MASNSNILIIGYGNHGKDTFGNYLKEYGYSPISRSLFVSKKLMMPYFESVGKIYTSPEECFEDRVNHRETWFREIENYHGDKCDRLSIEMSEAGYDVHVGLRSRKEFEASRYMYHTVFWIDSSERVPVENITSNELSANDADVTIDNNGSLELLRLTIRELFKDTEL